MGVFSCVTVGGVLAAMALAAPDPSPALVREEVLFDFSGGKAPEQTTLNAAKTRPASRNEGGLEVCFGLVEWPHIMFNAPPELWDWSAFSGIGVRVYNPTKDSVDFSLRLDNAGADGWQACNNAAAAVGPGRTQTLEMRFNTGEPEPLWGMRGVPKMPPRGEGAVIDPAKITAFQVFVPRPQQEHTLILEKVWLFGWDGSLAGIPMPFINRFGQYMLEDWPGKLKDEKEFSERAAAERDAWEKAPMLPERDRFGGWAGGPQLEGTGWFRTEKVNGKWWLVTPEGRLFLSIGMDCVGTWEVTFVEKREPWFEWLPAADDPDFGGFYGHNSGAHSMADTIGGEGKTFSFYRANLFRKYGPEWPERWRDSVYPRLKHWGFNTIANWSQGDVLEKSDMPYVVSSGLWGVPKIEGARGYWAKMMDVYDDAFETAAEKTAADLAKSHGGNPLCIGYFVDNELAWEGIKLGTLASPPEQPARKALVAMLREKYADIAALNAAWGTNAADWDHLESPGDKSAAAQADLSEYLHRFALRYFQTIQNAVRKHAPNQLYLGCRFAGAPDEAVRAAAEVVDVVSFNLYYREIPRDKWTDLMDRPAIIGEFHFGALDRGMFHTGLVRTKDQNERAESYAKYLRSVAEHPLFVGCHWFQYVDEPATGRWFDGENYNIGFLDATDTPYPELVESARKVHGEVYKIRFGE
ncbi:MAG: hypothetical protein GX580_01710 [Candidatus Hydrogenedens sp.]|nr:beta-galactosidase [Candidatus Hydrogenedentota bacterium]NLF56332.1 hypothetical protein [Candidatus Hydrogenedens sp.]